MANNNKLNKQISKLLGKGYSASKIAKTLHIRKQNALEIVRKIQNKPVNVKKLTNLKGQIGSVELDFSSKQFTEALYKQGYPIGYIAKLVNAKHSETSKNRVKNYIKQFKTDNPNTEDSHKANMKFYKGTGKWKQHLDAKYFRETNKHYFTQKKEQFEDGSPIIEVEDMEGKEGMENEIF